MRKVRRSTESDRDAIITLIEKVFGPRPSAYLNLEGRYMLLFDDDQLIGITGCNKSEAYTGYEIDWTCLDPAVRGNGYMTELISLAIEGIEEDIYCSCWRWKNNGQINLHNAMNALGFIPVMPARVQYDPNWCVCKDTCAHYEGPQCHCWEDLYLRRKR